MANIHGIEDLRNNNERRGAEINGGS